MLPSRVFSWLGRQADAARAASRRDRPSSPGGLAMKTIAVALLFAVAVSACAPAAAPTPTAIPATATAIPPTAMPTTQAAGATELRGTFKVSGRAMYIYCTGKGSPTVVLDGDAGQTVSVWETIQTSLAARTTTCSYDRAGQSFSDSAPTPRTAKDVVADLHGLLAAAAVPGPYVLVGNGFGGQFVQLYARTFPDQVVGVVAMDPQPPSPQWLDAVSKVFTAQELASEKATYGGGNAESIDLVTSGQQLAAAPQPSGVPFEILISTDCQGDPGCLKSLPVYEQVTKDAAAPWQRGKITEVASSSVFDNAPEEVVAAVGRVLAAH
jgi:pimeloyl-ACP methyl ester carboxylesterase